MRPSSGFDRRLHPDLETVQPRLEDLSEPGVGVEFEPLVGDHRHAREHVDLAVRLQKERPLRLTGGHATQILRYLGLQVRRRIRSLDHDDVTAVTEPRSIHVHSVSSEPANGTLTSWQISNGRP